MTNTVQAVEASRQHGDVAETADYVINEVMCIVCDLSIGVRAHINLSFVAHKVNNAEEMYSAAARSASWGAINCTAAIVQCYDTSQEGKPRLTYSGTGRPHAVISKKRMRTPPRKNPDAVKRRPSKSCLA